MGNPIPSVVWEFEVSLTGRIKFAIALAESISLVQLVNYKKTRCENKTEIRRTSKYVTFN